MMDQSCCSDVVSSLYSIVLKFGIFLYPSNSQLLILDFVDFNQYIPAIGPRPMTAVSSFPVRQFLDCSAHHQLPIGHRELPSGVSKCYPDKIVVLSTPSKTSMSGHERFLISISYFTLLDDFSQCDGCCMSKRFPSAFHKGFDGVSPILGERASWTVGGSLLRHPRSDSRPLCASYFQPPGVPHKR